MRERQEYINQLEEENRCLREEMFELKPFSSAWKRCQREIVDNLIEIDLMRSLINPAPAETEAESSFMA